MTNASLKTNESRSDSGPAPQPVLLLKHVDDDAGVASRRYPLEKFRLAIGRTDDSDICLAEGNGASRNHAEVFVLDGEVVIQDLASRNGTYVNRKLIRGDRQTTLNYGDVITIGKYRLKLVNEAQPGEPDDSGAVHRLMRLWQKAAVVERPETCAFCQVPRGVSDLPESTAIDNIATGTVDVEATQPVRCLAPKHHGVRFERDLPRRATRLLKRVGGPRAAPLARLAQRRSRLPAAKRVR